VLSQKKILLGITGSIAAYKALQILRDLESAGAQIQVVLSPTASRFVPPLTLRVFSGRPVLGDLFEPGQEMAHLRLAEKAELILIAPITAHFIAKMAAGLADDLLSTLLLASPAPVLIAPAMDLGMWEHPSVRDNVMRLEARGIRVVGPVEGPLASGKRGMGRMADAERILDAAKSLLFPEASPLKGKSILVTAGPTQEALDPVRFISNRSSGKMGYALAAVARERGACVRLISGPCALTPPPGVHLISVRTAREMKAAFDQACPEAEIVLMAAAVSDYRAKSPALSKRKKATVSWQLDLEKTEDILLRRPKGRPSQIVVGFAAETENLLANAWKKLHKKQLNLLVANDVSQEGAGFDVETNIVHLLDADGGIQALPKMHKRSLANQILDKVIEISQA